MIFDLPVIAAQLVGTQKTAKNRINSPSQTRKLRQAITGHNGEPPCAMRRTDLMLPPSADLLAVLNQATRFDEMDQSTLSLPLRGNSLGANHSSRCRCCTIAMCNHDRHFLSTLSFFYFSIFFIKINIERF